MTSGIVPWVQFLLCRAHGMLAGLEAQAAGMPSAH